MAFFKGLLIKAALILLLAYLGLFIALLRWPIGIAVFAAVGAALVSCVALLAGALLVRWILRSGVRSRRAIRSARGVETLERVRIGGIDQWIQIRGHDTRNPVIIFLHGGPGAAEMGFSHLVQDAWEKDFVCVQWDQRGAGKTYRLHDPALIGPTLTIEQMVTDAIEVIDFVRARLMCDRVFLHGHSWGSALGALVVKRCPEKLFAYVGEGQVVSMLLNEQVSYDFTLAEAHRRGAAKAVKALEAIGRPPYPEGEYMRSATIQRGWLRDFGYGGVRKTGFGGRVFSVLYRPLLLSPDYTIAEALAWPNALALSGGKFTTGKAEYLAFDLRKEGLDYQVPMFFFSGRMDYVTPSTVSAEFMEEIEAPYKEIVWFEESAHSPQREEPVKYLAEFKAKVAPYAASTQAPPDRAAITARVN